MIVDTGTVQIDVECVSYMSDDSWQIVVDGAPIYLLQKDFKIIKTAFDWLHKNRIYNKDMKKGGK